MRLFRLLKRRPKHANEVLKLGKKHSLVFALINFLSTPNRYIAFCPVLWNFLATRIVKDVKNLESFGIQKFCLFKMAEFPAIIFSGGGGVDYKWLGPGGMLWYTMVGSILH